MKSTRTYGIVVGTLALLLAGLASARASSLNITTHGTWLTGGPGLSKVYGTSGYILCDYSPGGSQSPADKAYDVKSLPSWVNANYTYSYISYGPVQMFGYGASSSGTPDPALQDPSDGSKRAKNMAYNGSGYPFEVSLTLAANAPHFHLEAYVLPAGGAPGSETITLNLNGVYYDSGFLTLAQVNAGTWVVFDVQPAGATQLDLVVASADGWPVLSGLMFDQVIPEPGTIALLGIGGLVLWLRRRSR